MTPLMLYDDLIAEVENILRDVVTKNTAGEDMVGVKGYKYRLPLITADDEDESQFFPYFIVRLSGGKTTARGWSLRTSSWASARMTRTSLAMNISWS